MSGYAVAHLDEIGEIDDGREASRPVRSHFGITSFGYNAWTGREAGDRLINEHAEAEDAGGQEELYLVHRGRARFELDGQTVDAPAGTLVFVPRGVKRTAFADAPGTTLIAVGGTPGEAYEPDGYEFWAPVGALYQAGEYAAAADRGRELIEAPGVPGADLQRGVLREPRRPQGRCARAPARSGRALEPPSPVRRRRLRLRRDPGRPRVQELVG
jgi:hypothetical protein